jgi:hypothetical protein
MERGLNEYGRKYTINWNLASFTMGGLVRSERGFATQLRKHHPPEFHERPLSPMVSFSYERLIR